MLLLLLEVTFNKCSILAAVKMENDAQSESVGTPRSPTPASGQSPCPLSQIGSSFAARNMRPPRPPAAFSEDDSEHVAKINPSDMAEIKGKRRTSWVWGEFNLQVDKNDRKAMCKHCKHKLSAKSSHGTKHLSDHLLRFCTKRHFRSKGQQTLRVNSKNNGDKPLENHG